MLALSVALLWLTFGNYVLDSLGQPASTATPTITSQVAMQWTKAEYLGLSKRIPAPTAMLASTLADNNQKRGQNGSKSPERNPLTYVSIAAVIGWFLVAVLASIRLAQSLLAWFKHQRKED
jgi:hypothetical protein